MKIVKDAIKGFRPGIPVSGRLIGISRKSAGHFTNSDYTDMLRNNDQKLYEDKLNIAQNLDDVVYATTDYINEDLKHPREDNITQFARGTVLLDIGGNKYEADVLVGYTSMQDVILYDVQDMRSTEFEIKEKKAQPKLAGNESYTRKTVEPSTGDIVPQQEETVKKDYSLVDSDGKQLTKEQQDFFEGDDDTHRSLSQKGEQSFVPVNRSEVYGKDIALEAPIREAQAVTEKAQTSEQMFPDDNEPVERPVIINKLTSEEIDENTYRILDRLDNGASVTANEISELKEVEIGQQKVNELRQNFVSEHPELSNVPQEDIGTYLLNSEKRNQLRENLISERLKEGSFSGFDNDGNEEYNGNIKNDKRLDIVIGLPASGKSSSIVNPLSEFYQSVVIDSDIVKRRLPEYNDGWGSMLVHEEASTINSLLFVETLKTGANIVLPIVGSKVSSVDKYINVARGQGYDINIHLNELPNGKAVGRMLNRYFSDGRFINPVYVAEYGNMPTDVYEQIKSRGDINGYSRWNNDVPKGQRPKLIEVSENSRLYGAYNETWRTGGGTSAGQSVGGTAIGETEQSQIAPVKETSSKDGVFFDAPVREAVVAEKATVEQMFPDDFAPVEEDIAPVEKPTQNTNAPEVHEAIRPKREPQPRMAKATPAEQASAQVLTEEASVNKKKPTAWNLFKDNIVDKGRLSWTAVTMKS